MLEVHFWQIRLKSPPSYQHFPSISRKCRNPLGKLISLQFVSSMSYVFYQGYTKVHRDNSDISKTTEIRVREDNAANRISVTSPVWDSPAWQHDLEHQFFLKSPFLPKILVQAARCQCWGKCQSSTCFIPGTFLIKPHILFYYSEDPFPL